MGKKKLKARKNHKDSLFCDLFSNPERALSLYNAINGSSYRDPSQLTIVTMKDVLLLHQKNDVSILFDARLTLWEHQSTYNPNMPLRGLLYYAHNMEGLLGDRRRLLYRKSVVKIPAPAYYVLYNGIEEMPERMEWKLSDAFLVPVAGYEWTAYVLNINLGKNMSIMEHCPELKGYATLVERIRGLVSNGLKLEDAIPEAVEGCIRDGVLSDYLRKMKGEAQGMLLTEFNEREWEEEIREESREEGANRLADLLKLLPPDSDEYRTAIHGTREERGALFQKYQII